MIQPDKATILEFWHDRSAILELEAGNTRMQAERQRLEKVRQLAALPGVRTGRQMQTSGR